MHVACCRMVFWVNLSQINCHLIHDQDSCQDRVTTFPILVLAVLRLLCPLYDEPSTTCDVGATHVLSLKEVS